MADKVKQEMKKVIEACGPPSYQSHNSLLYSSSAENYRYGVHVLWADGVIHVSAWIDRSTKGALIHDSTFRRQYKSVQEAIEATLARIRNE